MDFHKNIYVYMILLAVILFAYLFGFFHFIESKIFDVLLIIKYLIDPVDTSNVVVVEIDDISLQELGSWPLPRDLYAVAIAKLERAGAKVIGLDIIFANARKKKNDTMLLQELTRYNNIVLPVIADIKLTRGFNKEHIKIKGIDKPYKLFAGKTRVGHINFIPDRDGIIRRLDLYYSGYPAFSLELANLFLKEMQKYNQNKEILLNFAGPSGSFKHISFVDLLMDNFKPDLFKDKVVLIGSVLKGEGDRYMTPFSQYGYLHGVELHAHAVNSLIQGNYYQEFPFQYRFLLITILVAIIFYLSYALPPLKSGLWILVISTGYLFISLVTFYKYHVYIHFGLPLISFSILFVINLIKWYKLSEEEKTSLITNFSPYLVFDNLEEYTGKDTSLITDDGKQIIASVMFVDIRGFTDYSEGKTPEEIVFNLNQTFACINKIVFNYGGIIDKFIGDGMLVVFEESKNKNHHIDALKAALEIQKKCKNNMCDFSLGIGINSGQVYKGNIGTKERKDYTVIGDVVNKAAFFVDIANSGEIIAGEDTYHNLDNFIKDELSWVKDKIFLKGSNKKTVIYKLKG